MEITGIKKLRLERGMSAFALAMETGIHPATISNYENKKTRPPQESIDRLCALFGATEEELDLKPEWTGRRGRPLTKVS